MIATRLNDIASQVSDEAAQLTIGLREVGEHTRDIAALVADLEQEALAIDKVLHAQLEEIGLTRSELSRNRPALVALASSAETIASMSARIRDIAARSRMLSLNARIEAARNTAGNGFSAVAEAMGQLAAQTRATTDDIDGEARQINDSVYAAGSLIKAGNALADRHHEAIAGITIATAEQHRASGELRRLTSETVERVDAAANGIGRVASAASIVGVLARQMNKLASGSPGGAVASLPDQSRVMTHHGGNPDGLAGRSRLHGT